MALPEVTLRGLLEAGVHFGHHTRRWNPKMKPYIFGVRNQVHILDLQQTVPLLERALRAIRDTVAAGGRVLFVGTKKAAAGICGGGGEALRPVLRQPPLAGRHADELEDHPGLHQAAEAAGGAAGHRHPGPDEEGNPDADAPARQAGTRALGGIKEMGGLPDILFVIDTIKEKLAIEEANKLGIPVVAVLDSNSDPTGIAYPIPATTTPSAPSTSIAIW